MVRSAVTLIQLLQVVGLGLEGTGGRQGLWKWTVGELEEGKMRRRNALRQRQEG